MPGLPVLGNLLEFNRDRYGLLQRGYGTLGPIFSLRLGPKRAAVLIGPHYHQRFFEETDHTLSMAQAYKFVSDHGGTTGAQTSLKWEGKPTVPTAR